MFGRLIALAIIVMAVAVAAPQVAPGLLASLVRQAPEESPAVESPSATTDGGSKSPSPGYGRQVALKADPTGNFFAVAIVNGRRTEMMVDTGASVVALSTETAHRLGLYPPASDFTVPLSTANGVVKGAKVTLNEIRVGNISVSNVPAVVLPGDALPADLLGMNFLHRLSRFQVAGGELVLVQ